MGACEMVPIRDGYVREALERAREGDAPAAQELLDRAARVWPLEEEQVSRVRAALAAAGGGPLRDPNRLE